MAGSFGYEQDKYEVSMEVGEQTLFPQLRELDDVEICSEGFSCRHQIRDGVGKEAKHPAVIMWESDEKTFLMFMPNQIQVKDCGI
jgi:Fe-S oxidoreductase